MFPFRSFVSRQGTVLALALLLSGLFAKSYASDEQLTIYIDADYSITPAPAESIELGLRTAFAGTWAEAGIRLLPYDHRTNARRSLQTFQAAWRDPNAIAVVGGMHSPPYIANGTQINEGALPLFLTWSAGGSLTRMADGTANWIFRISVDDEKAAGHLAQFALESECSDIALVYVENPWGTQNAERLANELNGHGVGPVATIPLPFNASAQFVSDELSEISTDQVDCVILVSGSILGAHVVSSILNMESLPTLISHWGLLGSPLSEVFPSGALQRLDVAILGTCGLRELRNHEALYENAMTMASSIKGARFDARENSAPHGFFHAHDLGVLLLDAIERARDTEEWHISPTSRREAIRNALYTQTEPVEGLLKHYNRPFSPVTSQNRDGHEALDEHDLCMTAPNSEGNLIAYDAD